MSTPKTHTENISYTETPFDEKFVPEIDTILGLVCAASVLVGVPANLLSLLYFLKKKLKGNMQGTKAFFGNLYVAISLTDLVICATIIPVVEAFLNGRNSKLFENEVFCTIWGLLWEIIPFYSVFLVGVLSISRLVTLFRPHRILNGRIVMGCLGCYLTGLALSKTLPLILGLSAVKYLKNTMYCFFLPSNNRIFWSFSIVLSTALLAAPILPIIITCLAMIYQLQCSRTPSQKINLKRKGVATKQAEATKTIIIVTLVYIFYNIPVFIKFAHHLQYVIRHTTDRSYDYKTAYNTVLLYWYGWVLTYTVCVVLNSTTNPMVYFCRMRSFKPFVYAMLMFRFTEIKMSVNPRLTKGELNTVAMTSPRVAKIEDEDHSSLSSKRDCNYTGPTRV